MDPDRKEKYVGSEDGEFNEKGVDGIQNESLFCGFTERQHHKSMVSSVVIQEPVEEADTIGDKELVAVLMEKVEMAKAVDGLDGMRTVTHNAKVSQQMPSSVVITLGFDTNGRSIGVLKENTSQVRKSHSLNGIQSRSVEAGSVDLDQFVKLGKLLGLEIGEKEEVKKVLIDYGMLKVDP